MGEQESGMDERLSATLNALPPLDRQRARTMGLTCKICGSTAPFFDMTDFWKGSEFYPFGPSGVAVSYYRCETCGFMFTPFCDDWATPDFRRHIYNDQYTMVDSEYSAIRPQRSADYMAKWLDGCQDARILDYGSGTGLFAEHMRMAGFRRITSYDPFTESARPSGRFDIVTCFEVIEHSSTPVETIRGMAALLDDDACVLVGESLQPPDITTIRCSWWYCMPRNGHISLYTDTALSAAAAQAGLIFHRGDSLHAFSRPAGERFAALGDRISAPMIPIVLRAPGDGRDPLWHAVERFSGSPTRWTASQEISWRISIPTSRPALAVIRIPFVSEVRPGFATDSRVLVAGTAAKVRVVSRSIVAEATVGEATCTNVTLRTPEPIAPSELRNSLDHRRLGLAIQCE
jgi:hypothetical protein